MVVNAAVFQPWNGRNRGVGRMIFQSEFGFSIGSTPAPGVGFRALAETSSRAVEGKSARAPIAAPEVGAVPEFENDHDTLFFALAFTLIRAH